MKGPLIVVLLGTACASSPDVRWTGPVDITTTPWVITEDAVASVRVSIPCHESVDMFQFRVLASRKTIAMHRSRPGPAPGVQSRAAHESARGQWSEEGLVLRGDDVSRSMDGDAPRATPVMYVLGFDATSGNLIGTRNNDPIRLARAVVTKSTDDCGPAPR